MPCAVKAEPLAPGDMGTAALENLNGRPHSMPYSKSWGPGWPQNVSCTCAPAASPFSFLEVGRGNRWTLIFFQPPAAALPAQKRAEFALQAADLCSGCAQTSGVGGQGVAGWNVLPIPSKKNPVSNSKLPIPRKVTLFGDRIFLEIIELT